MRKQRQKREHYLKQALQNQKKIKNKNNKAKKREFKP